MSLFGAVGSGVSGLTTEASAFGNIGEDVASTQTGRLKHVDTNFVDYLTTSTPTNHALGVVVARPNYVNNIRGSVTRTDNPAIAARGFSADPQPIGQTNGVIQSAATLHADRVISR
jgi:flagellar hook protein FlgE